MKKTFCVILGLCFVGLCACSDNKKADVVETEQQPVISEQQVAEQPVQEIPEQVNVTTVEETVSENESQQADLVVTYDDDLDVDDEQVIDKNKARDDSDTGNIYDENEKIGINEAVSLQSDIKDIKNGVPTDVHFSVTLSVPVDYVVLFDMNNRRLGNLTDEAGLGDGKTYSDIGGDLVYTGIFTITEIEDGDREYYAVVSAGGLFYRTMPAKLFVYTPFTEEELGDMETVEEAIKELMESDKYKKATTLEERKKIAMAVLAELAKYGYIKSDSIIFNDITGDMIEFKYSAGVSGGVMLRDWDEVIDSDGNIRKVSGGDLLKN